MFFSGSTKKYIDSRINVSRFFIILSSRFPKPKGFARLFTSNMFFKCTGTNVAISFPNLFQKKLEKISDFSSRKMQNIKGIWNYNFFKIFSRLWIYAIHYLFIYSRVHCKDLLFGCKSIPTLNLSHQINNLLFIVRKIASENICEWYNTINNLYCFKSRTEFYSAYNFFSRFERERMQKIF